MKLFKGIVLAVMFAFSSIAFAQVNINTATASELDAVKNIGPAKAKAIVNYRKKNGDFKSLAELKNIKGIGPKIYKKIKGELVVGAVGKSKKSTKKADKKADKKVAKKVNSEKTDKKMKDEKAAKKAKGKKAAKKKGK